MEKSKIKNLATIPKDDKELIQFRDRSVPLVEKALSLKVESEKDLEGATDVLSKLNKYMDDLTEEKEKVTKPLNLALKNERARWKPIEEMYDGAISQVRGLVSAFMTAEAKRAKAEEAKIIGRVGSGKGKLSIDTAGRKLNEIVTAPEKVVAGAGMLKFRTDKKLKIIDSALIPREYLVPDEKKILEALKANVLVAGCEIEEIQVPINFR